MHLAVIRNCIYNSVFCAKSVPIVMNCCCWLIFEQPCWNRLPTRNLVHIIGKIIFSLSVLSYLLCQQLFAKIIVIGEICLKMIGCSEFCMKHIYSHWHCRGILQCICSYPLLRCCSVQAFKVTTTITANCACYAVNAIICC